MSLIVNIYVRYVFIYICTYVYTYVSIEVEKSNDCISTHSNIGSI